MGNIWSQFQSTKTCPIADICAGPSPGLAAGTAGAGVGTFWSFFITAFGTIILSFWAMLVQWLAHTRLNHHDGSAQQRRNLRNQRKKYKHVAEEVIISFSDQQLVMGLAMAITARFFVNCDLPISAYHYDIVCYLLLCSIVTHLCSIVAVDNYFSPSSGSMRGSVARCTFLLLRCTGIAATIILTALILFERDRDRFPVLPPPSPDDTDRLLLRPAACFFTGVNNVTEVFSDVPEVLKGWSHKNWSHGLVQFVLFILALIVALPVAILHSLQRGICGRSHPHKFIAITRGLVVCAGLGIVLWSCYLAIHLRNFMHNSGWLEDIVGAEKTWTFGQLMSMFILIFAPITALNAVSEKYDNLEKSSHHASLGSAAQAAESGYSLVKTGGE